jgi:hypothetical protein
MYLYSLDLAHVIIISDLRETIGNLAGPSKLINPSLIISAININLYALPCTCNKYNK